MERKKHGRKERYSERERDNENEIEDGIIGNYMDQKKDREYVKGR